MRYHEMRHLLCCLCQGLRHYAFIGCTATTRAACNNLKMCSEGLTQPVNSTRLCSRFYVCIYHSKIVYCGLHLHQQGMPLNMYSLASNGHGHMPRGSAQGLTRPKVALSALCLSSC